MKELNKETPSELLTRLMDNELEPEKESLVYEALSNSPDLQEEHKLHIAMKEAVKKDTEAFTPPLATVNALFNKLGYAPPPPAASGGIIRRSPFVLSFLRKAAVPILLLLVGSYGAYTVLDNTNENLVAENHIAKPSNNLKTESEAANIQGNEYEATPATNKQNTANRIVNAVPVMSSAQDNIIAKSKDEKVSTVARTSTNDYPDLNSDIKYFATNSDIIQYNNKVQFNSQNFAANNIIVPSIINQSDDKGIILYAKGINSFSSELGTAFSKIDNTLNNFSIGATFFNAGNVKGGLEFGIQPYLVRMSDSENEGLLIEQVRPVTWVALTGKYDLNYFEYLNTRPFGQLSFGFANFGQYLVRYSAGLDYKPQNSRLGLIAGYEGTNLRYTIQNQPFSTSNSGWFIGVTFSW